MATLVVSAVTHFYTVSRLTALTALKLMDPEFESIAASLKQPFFKLFVRFQAYRRFWPYHCMFLV